MSKKKKKKQTDAQKLREVAGKHQPECGLGQVLSIMADVVEAAAGDDLLEASCEHSNVSGPAQVATPQYRANYESIFGNKQVVGQA